jgi:hypothetical protein
VYLQGSYKNSTNTRGNSDVDIVAELTSSFRYDNAALTAAQRQAFDVYYGTAAYGWQDFRAHMEAALVAYFGRHRVQQKDKCIRVETEGVH